jgi:hypothetical protein
LEVLPGFIVEATKDPINFMDYRNGIFQKRIKDLQTKGQRDGYRRRV